MPDAGKTAAHEKSQSNKTEPSRWILRRERVSAARDLRHLDRFVDCLLLQLKVRAGEYLEDNKSDPNDFAAMRARFEAIERGVLEISNNPNATPADQQRSWSSAFLISHIGAGSSPKDDQPVWASCRTVHWSGND